MTERSEPADSLDAKRLAFIKMLNVRLPTKRVIAQGLLRNPHGEVLLCELTYKNDWDLPGGVVDSRESPATCVERECLEELGVRVRAGMLITTTWLPPYRGWDDAFLLLFDLGTVESRWVEQLMLQERELVAVHWVAPQHVTHVVAPYVARLIAQTTADQVEIYLENAQPRP